MNVTLLALNAKYIHCSPAPFYLAAELMDAGQNVRVLDHNVNESRETVLADMTKRDYDDSHRAIAPLRQAEDAVAVDTTTLTLQESIDYMLKLVQDTLEARGV